MNYEINDLLELMVSQDASDLHIQVGSSPVLRIDGKMTPVDGVVLKPIDTENLMKAITSPSHQKRLNASGGCDFAFNYLDKARFRMSVLRAKNCYGMVLRKIPNELFSLERIGLPDSIKDLIKRPDGLILVTGPTGCGKSTTLAAMINWINVHLEGHIITIEDPIEHHHNHKSCIVTQREIGNDVPSFADGIRGALRQDPDVILLGEMRDLETIEAAISAAETGHLVFGTLHTTGAARAVNRIIDVFPPEVKGKIRTQLALSMNAVISQILCKKMGGGRVAGFEVMMNTTSIAQLIRDDKVHLIASDIQTGTSHGMITLDSHLLSLYSRNLITAEEALSKSQLPDLMREKLSVSEIASPSS